jgi:hypothetical protein
MRPQDPKEVTRDTDLDLSGLVVAVGLGYSGGVHSVPPFSVGRAPRISAPAGPLLVVMDAKRTRPGLLGVRLSAAR